MGEIKPDNFFLFSKTVKYNSLNTFQINILQLTCKRVFFFNHGASYKNLNFCKRERRYLKSLVRFYRFTPRSKMQA